MDPKMPLGSFAGCPSWQPSELKAYVCHYGSESKSPGLGYSSKRQKCRTEAPVLTCEHFDAFTDTTFRGALVGPLSLRPSMWLGLGIAWLPLLLPGEGITEYLGDAVSSLHGRPLQFPPLHLHHIHYAWQGTNHFLETHGDYSISPRGYNRTLPQGFCIAPRPLSRVHPTPKSIFELQAQKEE